MGNKSPMAGELQVVNLPVSQLKPYKNNPRTHNKAQVRQLADSMLEFGFTNPVMINKDNQIVAGHGRVKAAVLLGMETVPTIRLEHLNEAQIKAYTITDNRLAEKSGWDHDLLALELQDLMTLDLDVDLTITGFDMAQIDLMVQGIDEQDPDTGDEVPELLANAVARLDDIWILGQHRLACGDALKMEYYRRLMNRDKAQMIFTDPPYNVKIGGNVSGHGSIKHDEFAMASGEMSQTEFTKFLTDACTLMAEYSIDGSMHFICMDWRHMSDLLTAGAAAYAELKNLCVWAKDNGGMGSFYRSRHELVFVFKNGTETHINNIELGKYGRNRTNVWNYRGVNTLRNGRNDDLAMHPTVKPVRMVADALLDCSHHGDVILDAFGGSGTTLIAAEKTGRKARLIELDPKYVDVTINRWEMLTGKEAIHEETGKTFAQRAQEVLHG